MASQRVHEVGGLPLRPAAGLDRMKPSGRRRRAPIRVLAAATVCLLVAGTIGVAASRHSFEPRMEAERTAARALAGEGPVIETGRMAATIGWLNGLSNGYILPTDVTARLARHHPAVAKAVLTAWTDLRSASGRRGMGEAMLWVDGLASGLILPTDVTSRLSNQDPRAARVVATVWEDVRRPF